MSYITFQKENKAKGLTLKDKVHMFKNKALLEMALGNQFGKWTGRVETHQPL